MCQFRTIYSGVLSGIEDIKKERPRTKSAGPFMDFIKIVFDYFAIVFTSFFGSVSADLSSTDFGSLLDDWFANAQSLFLSSPTEEANVFKEIKVKDKRISAFIKIPPLWFTQYIAGSMPIVDFLSIKNLQKKIIESA